MRRTTTNLIQDSKTPGRNVFVKRDNKDATKQGLTWIEMD
jgi:hypothetical protein